MKRIVFVLLMTAALAEKLPHSISVRLAEQGFFAKGGTVLHNSNSNHEKQAIVATQKSGHLSSSHVQATSSANSKFDSSNIQNSIEQSNHASSFEHHTEHKQNKEQFIQTSKQTGFFPVHTAVLIQNPVDVKSRSQFSSQGNIKFEQQSQAHSSVSKTSNSKDSHFQQIIVDNHLISDQQSGSALTRGGNVDIKFTVPEDNTLLITKNSNINHNVEQSSSSTGFHQQGSLSQVSQFSKNAAVEHTSQTGQSVSGSILESGPPSMFEPINLSSGATVLLGTIDTSFSCDDKPYGYYADQENSCRIFHICNPALFEDGRIETYQYSFLCGEDKVFDQEKLTCIDANTALSCSEAQNYLSKNEEFGRKGGELI